MRNFRLKTIVLLFLFTTPIILTSCAKYGCPANQELYNETMGVTKKEAKQKAKGNSGIKPPSRKKR